MTGYGHQGYAKSLAEFGIPRHLPACNGWLIERQVPGSSWRDAMGPYPLFSCQNWECLHEDLAALEGDIVSLALVTDPFGNYTIDDLRRCFDLVIPFKEHYIIDLSRPIQEIAGKKRRQSARKALEHVTIDVSEEPIQHLDEWVGLYSQLIERHNIRGVRAFSKQGFAQQLSIPGALLMRALHDGKAIGAHIYFMDGDTVHCHLGAYDTVGYRLGITHALEWSSIEYFAPRARWIDLGGGISVNQNEADGLAQYKRGWSTDTRTAYFCGRVFDQDRYAHLVEARGIAPTSYFPAYRKGEYA